MPARKRASVIANGCDNVEPIAKRRSSRQAAAAIASKAVSGSQDSQTVESKNANVVCAKTASSSRERSKQTPPGQASANKGSRAQHVRAKAANSTAKPARTAIASASEDTSTADGGKGSRKKRQAGSVRAESGGCACCEEDQDVDSIPAVNPEAPRHDGEWYWLMKAEPETRFENGHDVRFSIDDLRAKTKPEGWDGIRAYPARNNMRNMNVGDKAFFYHSNCKEPGIVGIMEIVKEFSEDTSARRPGTPYYDPSSTKDKPRWSLVHVEFRKKLAVPIYLSELRKMGEAGGPLHEMQMLKLGRLSVSKVSAGEWRVLCDLADKKAKEAGLEHEE